MTEAISDLAQAADCIDAAMRHLQRAERRGDPPAASVASFARLQLERIEAQIMNACEVASNQPDEWAVCRDELERHGIIRIIDRHYHTGKAMKWELGIYFPGLGLWKGKKLASLPVSIRRKRRRTREQEHNTWLRQQPIESTVLHVWTLPRPPPGGNWL